MNRIVTGLPFPLVSFAAACLFAVSAAAAAPATDLQWVKGDLHCHTINSDGVLPAPALARWYREHGYHFLFITDHNYRTGLPAESLKAINTRDFIVLPAEEFTGSYNIHVNIYGAPRALYDSLEFIHPFLYLRHALDAARSAGALASVNHPVWRFGVSTQDLMSLSGVTHFELINEGPKGANEGDSAHPSTERMWDSLLSAGKRILILTGDDAHTVDPARGSAGCAFVMARVAALNRAEILKSLREGRCYGSTGPLFKSIGTEGNVFRIAAEKPGLIEFIGTHGRVLKSVRGAGAEMALDTAEIYVRARLTGADGLTAWTQPVFLRRSNIAGLAEAEMDRFIAPLLSAEAAYRNDRTAEALKKYAEIRKNFPSASPYYHSLSAGLALRTGRILEMQGKMDLALKEFEFVIEKSPVTSHRIMAAKEIFALNGALPEDPKLEFV